MFESNSEFDFDDIEISNITYSTKCSSNNNSSPNKKRCIVEENFIVPQQSQKLLKKLDITTSPILTKIVSRKFPGPAGLLPEPYDINKVEQVKSTPVETEVICSQMSVNLFQEGPWEHMMKDFQPSSCTDFCLPDKYNIAWIKKAIREDKLINRKAPFLAGIIENVQCSKTTLVLTFNFVLKDVTGSLRGTMAVSHELHEEFAKLLINGTVIVLKHFGVLINENDSVHITTTLNNLVRIYTENEVIIMQDFEVTEFICKLKELKQMHKLNLPKFIRSPLKRSSSLHADNCILPFQSNIVCGNNLNVSCNISPSRNNKQKFCFKQKSVTTNFLNTPEKLVRSTSHIETVASNQINVDNRVLQKADTFENVFEGIDTDALFGDF